MVLLERGVESLGWERARLAGATTGGWGLELEGRRDVGDMDLRIEIGDRRRHWVEVEVLLSQIAIISLRNYAGGLGPCILLMEPICHKK